MCGYQLFVADGYTAIDAFDVDVAEKGATIVNGMYERINEASFWRQRILAPTISLKAP
jgi:hypothetical protein